MACTKIGKSSNQSPLFQFSVTSGQLTKTCSDSIVLQVTNLPTVRMFCIFTAVCVFLDYIYIITIFAGCMVYSGRREAAKRHACCIYSTTVPSSEAQTRSCCFRLCCTGRTSSRHPTSRRNRPEHAAMLFFRDTYGTFIMATPTKIAVGIGYALYLSGAIWGCLNIKQGLEMTKTVADDSYATKHFTNWDLYYRIYDVATELVVYGELDYSDVYNQHRIEQLISNFENSKYFHDRTVTHSWLRDFIQYTNDRDIPYTTKNISHVLTQLFQSEPAFQQYQDDISWNEDRTKIAATRYTLYPKDQTSPQIKMAMQEEMMRLTDQTSLNVTIVNPLSIFYEAWLIVLPNALLCFGLAAAAVLVVCLLLIPNPVCSIYVALSIVSMSIGLVGYMSLWDVYVDAVSMVNIIMAVGFSVDFTAHITYAFTVASGETRQERVRKALYGLGVPIVQGSLSTIFGVLVLCVSFVYVLRVFFITIFLTMIFGALHGLVFIPVLLSLIGPVRPEKRPRSAVGSDLSYTTYSSSIKPVGVVKPMRNIKPQLPPLREDKELDRDPKLKELSVEHLSSPSAFEQHLKSLEKAPFVFNGNSTIYLPRQEGFNKMPMRISNPYPVRSQFNHPVFFSRIDISYDQGDFVSQISVAD